MLLFALGGFVGAFIMLITYVLVISGRNADNYYRVLRERDDLKRELNELKEANNEKSDDGNI